MILRHVIRRIQANRPREHVTVRGGGHCGTPQVMDMLEDFGSAYILGLPRKAVLRDCPRPWCEDIATR